MSIDCVHTDGAALGVATAKRAPDGAGDLWTWLGLDAQHKLIVSFHRGARDAYNAKALMETG